LIVPPKLAHQRVAPTSSSTDTGTVGSPSAGSPGPRTVTVARFPSRIVAAIRFPPASVTLKLSFLPADFQPAAARVSVDAAGALASWRRSTAPDASGLAPSSVPPANVIAAVRRSGAETPLSFNRGPSTG
jgi:hypothetical protein